MSYDPCAVRKDHDIEDCWPEIVVPAVSSLIVIDLREKHQENAVNELDRDVEEHAKRKLLFPVTTVLHHPAEGYVGKDGLWNSRDEEDDCVPHPASFKDLVDEEPESEDVQEDAHCDKCDANFYTKTAATLVSVTKFGYIYFCHFDLLLINK